ncbi:hypothetical protein ACFHWD_17300 [Clostridium sp. MT-14]|uniref:hypothetical protein n=1 Tax=unclassified Clostridium TaxID=2614128 RepID=UPI00123BFC84|nr:hypothetical protein [Clostridium sp. HV4-5-A1G]KAA8666608.1 hypothetical protein F3O63_16730 [Clostridium sp. HV4-5-A1G]CAB1245187.1 conserved hypothetical protein [Clostridiaceae bacterium BL-3]
MKNYYCILDKNKLCDNCGECDVCDLDPNKKCDNCGKCLEMEGYDMKAIKIDGIIDDKNESREYEREEKNYYSDDFHSHYSKEDPSTEFIEDVDGLKEALENKEIFDKVAYEEYPGLIRVQKKHKNSK